MIDKKITFSFGRNWVDYVNNFLDEKKLNIAKKSLLQYLPEKEYKNKVFIDIGCGSGIFSLNALRLGCKKVISLDVDRYSIAAAKIVKDRFSPLIGQGVQWEIFAGSILDSNLVDKLKNKGDIVYSWGVLHHTSQMYQAIENSSQLVRPNSYLILAIYNRAPSSDFWLKVKRFYNLVPLLIKKSMVYALFFCIIFQRSLGFLKRKILRQPREPLFSGERGMSIFYDVIDWLGGYPYEYASFDEIKDFIERLGFKLIKAPAKILSPSRTIFNRFSLHCTGNSEFVFRKNETQY